MTRFTRAASEIGSGFIVALTNAMAQSAISYLPPGGVTLMKLRIQ